MSFVLPRGLGSSSFREVDAKKPAMKRAEEAWL